jgi:hypothetical protein
MKISKSKLKQIIKEELENILNEENEEKYRLIAPAPFCLMGKCRQDLRVVELATSEVTAAAAGQGKTKEEAYATAYAKLTKILAEKGLDIKKIQVLKK